MLYILFVLVLAAVGLAFYLHEQEPVVTIPPAETPEVPIDPQNPPEAPRYDDGEYK